MFRKFPSQNSFMDVDAKGVGFSILNALLGYSTYEGYINLFV